MRYFTFNTNKNMMLTACGQLVNGNGFLHQKRTIDENVLIIVNSGTLYINSNGKNYEVAKGSFIFLNANECHYGYKESNGFLSYYWVHFRSDTICTNKPPEDNESLYTIPETGGFIPNGKISLFFSQLSDSFFSKDEYSGEMSVLSLNLLLLNLAKENFSTDEKKEIPAAISGAAEWINSNYFTDFSVSFLADKYGYQADYFSSLFKKHMNISLKEYINAVRIRSSKSLLVNYSLSIKEVAYSCGYRDEKYFMRVFKESENITPTEYRSLYGMTYINNN